MMNTMNKTMVIKVVVLLSLMVTLMDVMIMMMMMMMAVHTTRRMTCAAALISNSSNVSKSNSEWSWQNTTNTSRIQIEKYFSSKDDFYPFILLDLISTDSQSVALSPFPLSLHVLILSPFPHSLSISSFSLHFRILSPFPHSLPISSQSDLQISTGCACRIHFPSDICTRIFFGIISIDTCIISIDTCIISIDTCIISIDTCIFFVAYIYVCIRVNLQWDEVAAETGQLIKPPVEGKSLIIRIVCHCHWQIDDKRWNNAGVS